MYSIGVNYIHVSNYYLKWKISGWCSSLQIGMARIYARCAITQSIYCDIKNTNLQKYCCQKILVIKNSYLPQVSWLLFSLQKNNLRVISDEIQKQKLKLVKSKYLNSKIENVTYIIYIYICINKCFYRYLHTPI